MDISGFGSYGSLSPIVKVYGGNGEHTLVGAFNDASLFPELTWAASKRNLQRLRRRHLAELRVRRPVRLAMRRRRIFRVLPRGVPPEQFTPVRQRYAQMKVQQGFRPPMGPPQGMGPRGPAAGEDQTDLEVLADDTSADTSTEPVEMASETPWGLIAGGLAVVGALVYYAAKKGAKHKKGHAD